jgi:hypothetical protein
MKFHHIDLNSIERLKNLAFTANQRAKASQDETRDAHYRKKTAAINTLIKAECAFVDSVDWSVADPTIGVTFVGGGRLHLKLSGLDLLASRLIRLQLARESSPSDFISELDSDYTRFEGVEKN